MMPQKNTAAIDKRMVAVRRLAARRGLTPVSGCMVSAKLVPYFTTGGVSNVWYGAGEGSVHSSVSAPSHGRAGAGAPPPAASTKNTPNTEKKTTTQPAYHRAPQAAPVSVGESD